MEPLLTVVDYGVGNLHSLCKALDRVGARTEVVADPARLLAARALVFPGVGAFGKVMEVFAPVAAELAARLRGGTPLLAVCIGMQILFEYGVEGECAGLGVFPGRVERLSHPKLPHMGWSPVDHDGTGCFRGFAPSPYFYFVHSFAPVEPPGAGAAVARSEHGGPFLAAVQTETILATQFHPEKSSGQGLALLRNFVEHVRRF
ncbi:MAG: imidazole glycerol phosphate synthase subunit HisH [Planctomycetes bacterium]|nr:imidazole glycerol phosphate synthase subunit HisH [Planctomycetota bacterium]